MSFAIEVDQVEKTYPRSWHRPPKQALAGVSFQVGAGESFGFIGQNGAGKSTLIKILVGVLRPTAGVVRVLGHDATDPESRRGLGFVPENPSLQESLTPLEILQMGLALHHVAVADKRKHCLTWLERFDLAAVANSPLRGFSKGMMQRTALAHAMAIRPRLLILDEPLSGLDPVGRKDVVDILDEYRLGGGTLFFSSHVLHDVERIADRFGLIHRGKLLTVCSPIELAEDQADSYVIRYRLRQDNALAGHGERVGLLEAREGELPAAIARLLDDGAVLQEVKPKASLESVFFRAISKADVAPG